jgi:branched-chain amino acid aminotransferase
MLYISEEVFFTGTAAEITPIRSVDKIPVGDGKAGPVTRALHKEFFDIVEGRVPDRYGWFTQVPVKQPVGV